MRILLMIDWNRGCGGAEAHALTLRAGLEAAGDEVRLLTSSAGTAGDGTADYVAYGTENRAQQAWLQVVNPFAAATVRRALREFRPDVAWINMFAHHLSPAALAGLGRLPKVLLVSDYKLVCPIGSKLLPDGSVCGQPAGWTCHQSGCLSLPHWLRDRPRYALIRSAVRGVDRIVVCSRYLQKALAEADFDSEVLYLPVPAPPPDFVRTPGREPVLLFCGRLDASKGVALLIRAFARLSLEFPAARLRIAGRGDERQSLESLARSLEIGAQIDFLGWKTAAELEPFFAEAWALVVPSLWAEPQGLVALEAMIRGVPVIASSAGGLGEIVEPGVSGLLFPNGDEAALLDHLRAIVSGTMFPQHTLAEEVAGGVAEDFSVQKHVRRMRQIFAEAI